MATLTCGEGGSTGQEIVDQINTNTGTVEGFDQRITQNETDIAALDTRVTTNETDIGSHDTRISTLETDSADHENQIAANEAAIAELQAPSPRATLHLGSPITITIGDSPVKINVFDTAVTSRGGFTADAANSRLINDTGVTVDSVIVSIGLNVHFNGTEVLDIFAYVNGNPYSNYEFTLRGSGDTKPQAIFWQSDITLNDGDIIEIYAVNGKDASDIDVTFQRTQFRIDAEVQDV